ncbi:hypothetical protein [Microbacterium sp. NPDC056569]|uniref:hypothetical protein n=1 Tax=Microbacterium sp. NPDC056569 TaxID=3345867 RepID=UPI00366DD8E1
MQFAGVLPEDAPDPRIQARRRLIDLPFPLMDLTPQPSIEDIGAPGFAEGTDAKGRFQLSVSLSYTLWRNPDDRSDPVNLRELDPQERAAIDDVPPWPRPSWLIEYVETMRYPRLWEAVRTSWNRDASEYTTLSRQLIDHANYILMNEFREELGLPPGPTDDGPWQVGPSSVNAAATLEIDGHAVPAAEIDTDPFVYAIGAQLDHDVVTTVVVPREHVPLLRIALRTRDPGSA